MDTQASEDCSGSAILELKRADGRTRDRHDIPYGGFGSPTSGYG
jgi:hypothetical protein